ncbi:MBL fold metallo-hydrolase [Vibrio algarum]|uniref:MBL fold metallo-hydrolase n=1 Tax=Vibrio algarum TaxID=3020714 RepID=A0ABT4YPE2_9VIBR|nr:MBL fold metallo-hydrolase [Vibrio sp. KJ40-1]MDB1123421.1 MBL fold metallo-hydrolase [Vibrio sp. KJ40-1]
MRVFKHLLPSRILTTCFTAAIISFGASAAAQDASNTTEKGAFDLEAMKEKYSVRDYVYQPLPERGYNYYQIAENTYFVHDAFEHQVFFVTEDGVIVYDAIPGLAPHTLKAIAEVTDKPITHVIYSHHHGDHARGMHLYPETAIKIGNSETAELLKEANDPMRPVPDVVWQDDYVLDTGGLRLEFKDLGRNWHSHSDSLVYAPEQKILLAIDTFHADAAPWIHFGEAVDPIMTWRLPKIILDTYDFDLIITGHERMVPTHEHFETYKEMVEDMKRFTYEAASSLEFQKKAKETMIRYSDGQEHWIYKKALEAGADICAAKWEEKWAGRVRNVRLNSKENCQTMWIQLLVINPESH